MRGRSRFGWSTAPTACASRATSGVSSTTSSAADTRPHIAGPSSASLRMASVNEMATSMPQDSPRQAAFLATAPRIRSAWAGPQPIEIRPLDGGGGAQVLVKRIAVRDRVDAVGELGLAVLVARDEGRGDDLADLGEVVGLEAARRQGRGPDAQARGDRRRARVERDGVAVDRDA